MACVAVLAIPTAVYWALQEAASNLSVQRVADLTYRECQPQQLKLDVEAGFLYFTEFYRRGVDLEPIISRARLDGSGKQHMVRGLRWFAALDIPGKGLYYTEKDGRCSSWFADWNERYWGCTKPKGPSWEGDTHQWQVHTVRWQLPSHARPELSQDEPVAFPVALIGCSDFGAEPYLWAADVSLLNPNKTSFYYTCQGEGIYEVQMTGHGGLSDGHRRQIYHASQDRPSHIEQLVVDSTTGFIYWVECFSCSSNKFGCELHWAHLDADAQKQSSTTLFCSEDWWISSSGMKFELEEFRVALDLGRRLIYYNGAGHKGGFWIVQRQWSKDAGTLTAPREVAQIGWTSDKSGVGRFAMFEIDSKNEWLYEIGCSGVERIKVCEPEFGPDILSDGTPCIQHDPSTSVLIVCAVLFCCFVAAATLIYTTLKGSSQGRVQTKCGRGKATFKVFAGLSDVATDILLLVLLNKRRVLFYFVVVAVGVPILIACMIAVVLGHIKFLPYLLCTSMDLVRQADWCKANSRMLRNTAGLNTAVFLFLEDLPQLGLEVYIITAAVQSSTWDDSSTKMGATVFTFFFTLLGISTNIAKLIKLWKEGKEGEEEDHLKAADSAAVVAETAVTIGSAITTG